MPTCPLRWLLTVERSDTPLSEVRAFRIPRGGAMPALRLGMAPANFDFSTFDFLLSEPRSPGRIGWAGQMPLPSTCSMITGRNSAMWGSVREKLPMRNSGGE